MLEPHNTAEFLDKLEAKGFTNEHLRIVHFKPKETINSHRNYAQSKSKFDTGGRNHTVCKRLQFITKHRSAVSNPNDFTILAKVASKEFPMPRSKSQK